MEVPYFLIKYHPEALCFHLPEIRDTEFSWEDFVDPPIPALLHGADFALAGQAAHVLNNLAPSQRRKASALLAGAFHDDPLFRYAIPQDGRRARALSWLFSRVVHYSLLYGQVYTTPTTEGVVCWLPPGRTELIFGRVLRTGLQSIVCRFGLAAYQRFDRNQRLVNETHKRHAPEHHWYLWALGVGPSSQGKGLGGALLRPVLALADAARTPCYLETHNESNLVFYEKRGFRVVSEGNVPKRGPQVWAMLREPQC